MILLLLFPLMVTDIIELGIAGSLNLMHFYDPGLAHNFDTLFSTHQSLLL